MSLGNVKIGKKLIGGFILILLLLGLVGYVGYTGVTTMNGNIGDISEQIEIANKANTALVDAQDAQAGALRFLIYRDDKYNDIVAEESKNVLQELEDAKGLMNSDENKKVADKAITAMSAYAAASENLYKLAQEKATAGTERAKGPATRWMQSSRPARSGGTWRSPQPRKTVARSISISSTASPNSRSCATDSTARASMLSSTNSPPIPRSKTRSPRNGLPRSNPWTRTSTHASTV